MMRAILEVGMSQRALVLCVLAIGTSLACQGKIVPLSAQAGSTIVIPISGDATGNIGFGGTVQEDYQRGTLVYQLDGPGGFELTTRASGAFSPVPNSAIVTGFNPKRQIVSLVDIPANAPVGTHTLHVKRRRIESGTPVDYTGPVYHGEITILPNELEIDVGGTPVIVEGESTPFQRWNCPTPSTCAWANVSPVGAIPTPELRLTNGDFSVGAVELEIEYPADVITVTDVYEVSTFQANHLAVVWFEDDAVNGVLRLGAAATTPDIPILSLGISYTLDDGAEAILDLEDVDVTVENVWDLEGAPISATFDKDIY
jgi:hypothetical protein